MIVAGGAFNSPQILQLSGLGPEGLLKSLGIDVVADMPGVGADLQDHLQVRMQYRCTESITMNDVINSWRHLVGAGVRYAMFRKGLLTIGAGYAGGFFRANAEAMTPDVQVHFIIFSADTAGATLHPFPGFIASVCQLRPQSRGFVRIKSADPREPPAIQPRYLSRPYDCDTVIAGMKLLRRIMTQPAMRHYIAEERAPDPRCTSDADLLAFARENGTTVFHPTSTCRMGSDAAAVVDERLRVRGIERLRVVDGSIMPTVERHASGEIDWTGRILKCGDAMLRSYLFEAAGVLLTRVPKWSALKAWGMRLAKPDCCQKPSSHSQKIPLPAPQPETVELDLVNPLRSGRRA